MIDTPADRIRAAYEVFCEMAPMAALHPDLNGMGDPFHAHKAIQDAYMLIHERRRLTAVEIASLDALDQGRLRILERWMDRRT